MRRLARNADYVLISGLVWRALVSFGKGTYVILNNKSVKRFDKLFTSFIAYANDWLQLGDNLCDRSGRTNYGELFNVTMEAFYDEELPSVVSDYVRDNPDRLSRTDLREISQWEHGVAGSFFVTRDGRDTVFVVPGFAIAVRGFMKEIDTLFQYGTLALCETVLLPFENVVVYAHVINETSTDVLRDIGIDLDSFKTHGRTVRSARDLMRYADDIRAACDHIDHMFYGSEDDDAMDEEVGGLDNRHAPHDEVEG